MVVTETRGRNSAIAALVAEGAQLLEERSGSDGQLSRPKSVRSADEAFGERIASRDADRQSAEIQIRIAIMNRFSALGTAEIKAVA